MTAAALPDWLEPQLVRWLLIAAMALVALLLLFVARFVQRLLVKLVLLVVLVGLGVSLWIQRADLQDCALTCECSLYGREVVIPFEQLPENLRSLNDDGEAFCLQRAA
ncbi:MAG: hypothetical protein OXH78_04865 [Acidimicrobiaceae bacterium]|nr:hypothetical protein [Acidimicrobiaceae bacterium]